MLRVRLSMLAVTVGLLVVTVGGSATANAAPSVSFTPSFAENSHLGEATVATARMQFSGSEYGSNSPEPLVQYTLSLPAGTTVSNTGFATCSYETMRNFGPAACPLNSHAGPTGKFAMILSFGTERIPEEGRVEPFFSPEGGVDLFLEAHTPVQLEFVAVGHYEPEVSPLGPSIRFEIPLVETVPGARDASFTELAVELGAFRNEAGEEVGSILAPGECPKGHFGWQTESGFAGLEGNPPATVTRQAETPCLPAGKRVGATTALSASRASLLEGETDTYTATVTPKTGGGPAPSGTVSFYENGFPIFGCTDVTLAPSGGSATAACNATPIEGPDTIIATYSGDSNYRQSESQPVNIFVESLEEQEPNQKAEEAAKKKAEQEAAAKKKAEEEAAAKKKAEQEAAAKKKAEEEASAAAKKKLEEQIAQTASGLSGWLAPHGKLAKLAALLKHGGYTFTVTAPAGGVLVISWYEVPKGAHFSARKPVLIATGTLSIAASHSAKLTIKLTGAGKRLLKRSHAVKLTSRGTFTPTTGTPIIRLKTFTLSG